MRKWVKLILLASGVLLCTIGAITTALWPKVFESILNMQLALSESSKSFEIWRDTPVPMKLKIYFFNWTNPGQLSTKEKPSFVEMGPYTFNEFHEKVNLSFNDNDTITFERVRIWKFDPEESNGSLDDLVTTLNVPPLTAAFVTRNWGFLVQTSLSYFLNRFEKMVVTKKVKELLFDGYTDPLISLADTLPALANVDIPFDKFGWFYSRNGSSTYDGIFNMDTGRDNIEKLGRLREWNYQNHTDFYEGHCGNIVGSAGELWPPYRKKDSISMFSSDMCRSIELPYESETMAMGIPAYRYTAGVGLIDNGTIDKSNECYCGGQCMPVGVVNASSCRYGSPAFISYPHFLNADPYYSSLIQGMAPDSKKHSFYITIEPRTGIPIDVAARLQINILLQPSKHISMYQKVPEVFFPMIWFEQTATMTPEMASSIAKLLGLAEWGVYLCISMLGIGILLIASVVITFIASIFGRKPSQIFKAELKTKPENIHITKPLVPTNYGKRLIFDGTASSSPITAPYAVPEDTDEYNGVNNDYIHKNTSLSHKQSPPNGLYPSFNS
ncbi:protein croquemort-like isoform X2 [Hetaerina americana]